MVGLAGGLLKINGVVADVMDDVVVSYVDVFSKVRPRSLGRDLSRAVIVH